MSLFTSKQLRKIKYTIIIKDIEVDNCFYVDCSSYDVFINKSNSINPESILTLETTSKYLNFNFKCEWIDEDIASDNSIEINILDLSIVEENLDVICVRLLTNQSVAEQYLVNN